jgi:hypothetical protein
MFFKNIMGQSARRNFHVAPKCKKKRGFFATIDIEHDVMRTWKHKSGIDESGSITLEWILAF